MSDALTEAAEEMKRLSTLLDDALSYLRRQIREVAEAEEAYRNVKAAAWVNTDSDLLAKEREAQVDAASAEARKRRDLAEGMKRAGFEAVKSRRAQISALQSLLSKERAVAEIANYGPDFGP